MPAFYLVGSFFRSLVGYRPWLLCYHDTIKSETNRKARRHHHDTFLTGLYHRTGPVSYTHLQVHAQAGGRADEDLFIFYIHIVLFFVILADLSPQLRVSSEIRIFGMTSSGVLVGLVDDQSVRDQVRVAQAQVDDVVDCLLYTSTLKEAFDRIAKIQF